MRERSKRVGAAMAAVFLLSFVAGGPAAAAPTGVGESVGATTLLSAVLGSASGDPADQPLTLRIGGEDGVALLDSVLGTPHALERLVPLSLSSTLVDAINDLSLPVVEARSDGETAKTSDPLNLAELVNGLSLPGLLSGTLTPAQLTAILDGTGARSALTGALDDLSILGGLLDIESIAANLGSGALVTDSQAVRGLTVESLEILDLTGLLQLLGLGLGDLSLDSLLGLVGGLGLPIDGLGVVDLTALDALLNTLLGSLEDLLGGFCDTGLLDGLLPLLPLPGLTCEDESELIAATELELTDVLDGLLGLLDGAPLLALDGIDLSVVVKAADTVAGSVADVVAEVGAIRVGGLELPGLDLDATTDAVNELIGQITSELGSILGLIDASLVEGILDIDLLAETASVEQAGEYVKAVAGVTGLRLAITPPDICGLLEGLLGGGSGSLLELPLVDVIEELDLGAIVPLPTNPVADLLGGLGSNVACGLPALGGRAAAQQLELLPALTDPLTISVLSLSETARFRVPAAPVTPGQPVTPTTPTTSPTLPQTGGSAWIAVVGAGLGAAVLFGRRKLSAR